MLFLPISRKYPGLFILLYLTQRDFPLPHPHSHCQDQKQKLSTETYFPGFAFPKSKVMGEIMLGSVNEDLKRTDEIPFRVLRRERDIYFRQKKSRIW